MESVEPFGYHVPRLKLCFSSETSSVLNLGLFIFLFGLIGAAGQDNAIMMHSIPDLGFDPSDMPYLPLSLTSSPLFPDEGDPAAELDSEFESRKILVTGNTSSSSANSSSAVLVPVPESLSSNTSTLPAHELIQAGVVHDDRRTESSNESLPARTSESLIPSNDIGDHNREVGVLSLAALEDPQVPKSVTINRRAKRSVVHLYDMVVCATGCNPLNYKGYGCYCGFLGSGLTVDGIDRCCAKHDICYNHAKCPPLLTYFVPYYWTCNDGRPNCVSDYRGWKGICGAHLCECDRQFAECLRNFPCPRARAMCMTSPWRFWQNLAMQPPLHPYTYH